MRLLRLITLLGLIVGVGTAATDWTDWSSQAIGGLNGTLMSGSIKVVYTGEYNGNTQVPPALETINYFTNPAFTAYYGVTNAPGTNELVALQGQIPNTPGLIEFRDSTTNDLVNVNDPILAFVSLGRGVGWDPAVHYAAYKFEQSFRIIDQGIGAWSYGCPPTTPCGPGSGGTPLPGRSDVSPDNKTLYGWEWHGMIQFIGSYSSISFQVQNGEYWNGFTVGTDSTQFVPNTPTGGIITPFSAVPEPSTFALGGLALGALAMYRRRVTR